MDRTRQAKWDGENLRTACTKMTRRDYERFRLECWIAGKTPYAVIGALIREWMTGR